MSIPVRVAHALIRSLPRAGEDAPLSPEYRPARGRDRVRCERRGSIRLAPPRPFRRRFDGVRRRLRLFEPRDPRSRSRLSWLRRTGTASPYEPEASSSGEGKLGYHSRHVLEAAVVVQQHEIVLDGDAGDQAVDCGADRHPGPAAPEVDERSLPVALDRIPRMDGRRSGNSGTPRGSRISSWKRRLARPPDR